jgi:transcription elongation factor Elf1
MAKRTLRVVKWLSSTPAIGVCGYCSQQFKVPMSSLSKTADAQAYLQHQFDAHKCEHSDSSQNASVREATENK